MALIRHSRKDATGSTEYIPGVELDFEAVEGWSGANLPRSPAGFSHGFQARALKVANQVANAQAGNWYPDDGTGTLPAQALSGQASVQLHSTVLQAQHASLTPVGMILACRYATGPDAWELVRVTGWTSGTYTVTVNRNLTNTWPSSSKYHLLYDVRLAEWAHIFSEFSASSSSAVLTPYYFSWVDNGGIVSREADMDLDLSGTAVQGAAGEIRETNYYYGQLRTRPVRGLMAMKLRLVSVNSTNSVSLWMARS